MKGAADQNRNLGGVRDFLGPFHDRRRHPDEIAKKKRVCQRVAGILLSSCHDQGCARHPGIPEATEAVAKPTRRVEIDESCAA